jgi:CYTH domain-containing protein
VKKNGALQTEIEAERKFAVDPTKLPTLPEAKPIIQGYWQGDTSDTSVRVAPTKQRAFLRDKSRAVGPNGERTKTWQEIPYGDGRRLVATAPKVAVKDRYTFDEGGRTWKVEHYPAASHWQAETEHQDENPVIEPPEWAMHELTGHPAGYTVNYARPMRPAEVDGMVRSLEGVPA